MSTSTNQPPQPPPAPPSPAVPPVILGNRSEVTKLIVRTMSTEPLKLSPPPKPQPGGH